jgi:hypothetical protein
MEVSSQLHALADLYPQKNTQHQLDRRLGELQKEIWTI